MPKVIKIIQEGIIDEQKQIVLPGSLTWPDEPVIVTRSISLTYTPNEIMGYVHNLRREDNWIVGDADFEFEDQLYSPLGLIVKTAYSLEENGTLEITGGQLTLVVFTLVPYYPKIKTTD